MGLADFVEYQQGIRPGIADAIFIAEWNAKLIGQKQKWTRKRNAAQDHLEEVLPLQQGLDNAREAFQRRYDQARNQGTLRTSQDCEDWKVSVEALDRMYQARKPDWQRYAQLLQEFHDEEATHASHDQASLNDTITERQNALQIVRDNEQNRLELIDYLAEPPMAQDPQGRPRMPEHWLPPNRQRLRTQFNREVAASKRRDQPGLQTANANQTWRAAVELGGGMSKSVLWLRFDDEELVEDRVLRKAVLMNERDWIDPTRWKGDVRSTAGKEPLELVITDEMDGATPYSVAMRERPNIAHHVNNRSLIYIMYLEWVSKGDLAQLIREYQTRNERLPEPFLWHVLEALALCGKAMAPGQDDDNGFPDEIVHRDLKPANVFLDDRNNTDSPPPIYPDYDIPVLGDYGLAIQTHANDDFNPKWYNNRSGTQGFLAPEQMKHLNVATRQLIDEERLDEKTNVYGVGLILYCMMTNTNHPPEPAWLGDPTLDDTLAIPAALTGHWSATLRGIVRDCLLYNPASRPTFVDILKRVRVATNESGANAARYMRKGTATAAQKAMFMPHFLQDRYAHWMSADAVGVDL